MSPRKILHLTYDMNIGGTEQVIRNLVEGLDPNRFRSSVLCIDGNIGPWGQHLQARGIEHICLQRRPGFDTGLIRAIHRLLRREPFDLLHCHQYTPYTYGWFGALGTGKPVIFTEHGRFYPDVSHFKRRLINPFLQRRTAAITAISAATKQALVDYENLSADKIAVIYNGIADTRVAADPTLRHQLGFDTDDIVLGTISRLDPIKNQAMLLRAFKQARGKNKRLRLLIVGDGPLRADLHELAAHLNIADAVVFAGFQPNPQAYLALMDIFLLPSLSEGTSMTLLEAMSFAKPSIATAVGGTPEILTHRDSGLLIANEDEPALVTAIEELAAAPALRATLGANARRRYEQRFSLEAMTREYEKLYDAILR